MEKKTGHSIGEKTGHSIGEKIGHSIGEKKYVTRWGKKTGHSIWENNRSLDEGKKQDPTQRSA